MIIPEHHQMAFSVRIGGRIKSFLRFRTIPNPQRIMAGRSLAAQSTIAARRAVRYAHGLTKQQELGKLTIWRIIRPHLSWLARFFRISFIEARSEQQSSYLGILWMPISTLIFTIMLALVFQQHDNASTKAFYLYVLAGYILWNFIATTITSSTTVIQKRFEFAVHNNLTLSGLFFKLLIDRLFSLCLNLLLLACAVTFLAPGSIGPHLLLVPGILIILALVSLAVAYLVNLTVIFFPDLDAIFQVGIRFLFFVSPIFWSTAGDGTGTRAILTNYNPISHYLSAFRQSFGIGSFEPIAWIVMLGTSFVLCAAGIVAYERTESFVRNLK
ncbi:MULTISPECIES: ABC transporter permease [unclassified Aminobacter]|uniref:ABC transporter permease n=1 Tax=unclassified Aminobacter TaxID=2644704 RepID=UPI0011AC2DDE|nr:MULTISPECIES: ABC transporter permease [unclassified Aminobacter]TWH28746.1 lipopolysaccharide transport system permease protein [Aminobacter sp. J15]